MKESIFKRKKDLKTQKLFRSANLYRKSSTAVYGGPPFDKWTSLMGSIKNWYFFVIIFKITRNWRPLLKFGSDSPLWVIKACVHACVCVCVCVCTHAPCCACKSLPLCEHNCIPL